MSDEQVTETAQSTAQGEAESSAEKVFEPITSQDEFDRRLGERLAREREKYADYDEIKSRLATLEDESKTEVEKAVEQARAEALAEAAAASDQRLIQAEIRAVAANAGFHDPADAVRLYGATDALTVADDGAVDADAIATRLSEIAEQKPYLVQAPESPRSRRQPPKPKEGERESRPSGKAGAAAALRQLSGRR